MPEILDWQQSALPNAVAATAAQALAQGRLVVFPTETAYAVTASALIPDAIERLSAWDSSAPDAPLCIALRDADDVLDWVPGLSPLGQRLARRCWPGPVELIWGDEAATGLVSRLAEPIRQRLCSNGTLGIRTPAHEAILRTLRLLPGPVALKVVQSNGEEAATPEPIISRNGDDLLVIDDGPCRYGRPTTVVRIDGNRWQVLREGIVSQAILERLTSCVILFVCTGNTCRSPLAEGLCKKLLADRLGCPPDELPQRGFVVQSAGLSAMMGGRAADEAVLVAGQHGADLSGHASQPLTADRLSQADYVVTMTRSHLQALEQQFPRLGPRPRLLDPDGYDLADPIGGSQAVYDECARQILRHLERFLTEVQPL